MKILKKKKARRAPQRDPEKESVFKGLAGVLRDAGYEVRREKLKQGHGWKVASGSCRVQDSNLIFVDSRLTQDDQNTFLLRRIHDLRVQIPDPVAEKFPDRFQRLIQDMRSAAEQVEVSAA